MLSKFYEKFPQLKDNDLYLSGESYAGIYVPQFAKNIHLNNQDPSSYTNETYNLKGIMVGNGVTNWTYDTIPASLEFSYQRGLIDTATYDKAKEWGCDFTNVSPLN